jgi:hypothetical protein
MLFCSRNTQRLEPLGNAFFTKNQGLKPEDFQPIFGTAEAVR